MPEVRQLNLGWEIKPTVNSVATSMKEALESSQSSNCEIGVRGKQLIQERYGWKTVALQMSEIYRWVEGGAAPTSVEVLLHE